VWTVEDGNQDGHAQIGIDEGACRLVTPVEVAGLAETKIDRDEHQTRAMSDRCCKGPEPQLRRSYPRQYPRMAPARVEVENVLKIAFLSLVQKVAPTPIHSNNVKTPR
jgi:hypothetical protein